MVHEGVDVLMWRLARLADANALSSKRDEG